MQRNQAIFDQKTKKPAKPRVVHTSKDGEARTFLKAKLSAISLFEYVSADDCEHIIDAMAAQRRRGGRRDSDRAGRPG